MIKAHVLVSSTDLCVLAVDPASAHMLYEVEIDSVTPSLNVIVIESDEDELELHTSYAFLNSAAGFRWLKNLTDDGALEPFSDDAIEIERFLRTCSLQGL